MRVDPKPPSGRKPPTKRPTAPPGATSSSATNDSTSELSAHDDEEDSAIPVVWDEPQSLDSTDNGNLQPLLVSAAFWLSLFVAAGLYAAVALAPTLVEYLEVKDRYVRNQIQLVNLERQATYFERVAEELERNPELAAELARIDFDAVPAGDERIAVDRKLSLDAPSNRPPLPDVPPSTLPWYLPVLKLLAHHGPLRATLLTVASVLVLLAFTLLHESFAPALHSAVRGTYRVASGLVARYRKRA